MKRYKLGLGNKTILEQIAICRRVVSGIGRLPAGQRAAFAGIPVAGSVEAAAQAHAEVMRMKGTLKAAVARCGSVVREMRSQTANAANILMILTNGEPASLMAAGLDVVKDKQSVGQPGAPRFLRVVPMDYQGTVRLRWKRPVRRCIFNIQMSWDKTMRTWTQAGMCLRQTFDVKNLPSGKRIWFRVGATNAHGPGPWSNPICAWAK